MTQEKEFKAVKFDHYGGLDVLHLSELRKSSRMVPG
jgi:hypothetical protein